MTAADHTRNVRVGGEVHFPDDLRIPIKGERNPESLRAILGRFLVCQVRDDPLALAVLVAWVVGGIALIMFLLAG